MVEHDESVLANVYLNDNDCYISIGFNFLNNKESIVQHIKKAIDKLPDIIKPDKYEYQFLHEGKGETSV